MKAITIKAPWSIAVAAGIKTIENRGRSTDYRGPIAIHCAATWSRGGGADLRIRRWWLGRGSAERRPEIDAADFAGSRLFRHVLAVADLVDCHDAQQPVPEDATCCWPWGDRRYGEGPAWHLVLANVRRLATPIPAVGRLAVPWNLPDDIAAAVEREMAECSSF